MNFHPAFIAQVKRNRAVAIYTLVGAADRFLLRLGVVFGCAESFASLRTATAWRPAPCGLVHHEGVKVGTDIALVRSNRRLGALKKPQRQFVRRLAQLRPFGIEPLADLRRLAALPDQRQPGIGGESELCRLLDFKAGHGQLGEEG